MNIFDKARKDHGPVSQQSPSDEFSHIETVRPPVHQRDDNPDVQARLHGAQTETGHTSRRKLLAGIIGGAVLAGGATAFGVRQATKQEAVPAPEPTVGATENPGLSTEPTTEPTASESQPSTTETELSREELIKKAEIPAGLSDKEYAEAFITDRLSTWTMAAATPDLADKWMYESTGAAASDATLQEATEKVSDIYVNALFVSDWQSRPELKKDVEFQKEIIASRLELYVMTSFPDVYPDDKEPLTTSYTVESVKKSKVLNPPTDGGRIIEVVMVEHNNSEQNRYKTNPNITKLDGDKTLIVLTTTIEDGVEKVTYINTPIQ